MATPVDRAIVLHGFACEEAGPDGNRPVVHSAQGLVLAPDGKFGPATAEALHSFQQASGIPSSDTVDAATAAALDGGSGAGAPVPV